MLRLGFYPPPFQSLARYKYSTHQYSDLKNFICIGKCRNKTFFSKTNIHKGRSCAMGVGFKAPSSYQLFNDPLKSQLKIPYIVSVLNTFETCR